MQTLTACSLPWLRAVRADVGARAGLSGSVARHCPLMRDVRYWQRGNGPITGQAPVARLHKEDFQAVDIASIARPLTKMAMTVLEPAQVPGAFQRAFHLMRSGRPGLVLIDLPFDGQMAEIDFDPDTYAPLPGQQRPGDLPPRRHGRSGCRRPGH